MLLYYFPKEHYGNLTSFLTLPVVFTMWLIDPLYRAILGGNTIQNANSVWVSFGFVIFQGRISKFPALNLSKKYEIGKALGIYQLVAPKHGLIALTKMSKPDENIPDMNKDQQS